MPTHLIRPDSLFVWVSPEVIEEAGISPWIELPIWLPRDDEYGGMHDADVSAAHSAGLACRPMQETVADTWAWLQTEGDPKPRPGKPQLGLDPAIEKQVIHRLARP